MTLRRFDPPRPLVATHVLDEFECGEQSLDDWLKRRALAINQAARAARSWSLTAEAT